MYEGPMFVMNGNNYTQHIKVGTYNLNKEDVVEEWKDANYSRHEEFIRTQVKGSFTMIFDNPTEYRAFLDELVACKGAGGTTLASFYCFNTDELITAQYYIKYSPTNDMPFIGNQSVDGLVITVEEY